MIDTNKFTEMMNVVGVNKDRWVTRHIEDDYIILVAKCFDKSNRFLDGNAKAVEVKFAAGIGVASFSSAYTERELTPYDSMKDLMSDTLRISDYVEKLNNTAGTGLHWTDRLG